MKTIVATNYKGGVGKSITSRELAYIYGKAGDKILVIDLDPQKGITSRTPIENDSKTRKSTIKLVLEGYLDIEEAIVKTEFYDIIPGDERLKNASSEFDLKDDKTALKEVISSLDYDYVIIDLGPSDSILHDMAYIASDYVIICTDNTPESIKGITKIDSIIKKYNEEGISNTKILGTLICRVKYQFGKPSALYRELKEALSTYIKDAINAAPFETLIHDHDDCPKANSVQMAVNEYNPDCSAAKDYMILATEIKDRIANS